MSKDIIVQNDVEIVKVKPDFSVAREVLPLDKLMEMSEMLSQSTIVPADYRNRPENCFIALDMASRMGVSPMMVMQNLFIIQGKPSFSGQAIASLIRANPNFTNVNLEYVGEPMTSKWGAYVTATRKSDGRVLKGTTVTMGIAKAEGWIDKNGSKWKTMPEQMLAYRAYAWFGRVHVPELMMGLQSTEEVLDVESKHEDEQLEMVLNPFEGD